HRLRSDEACRDADEGGTALASRGAARPRRRGHRAGDAGATGCSALLRAVEGHAADRRRPAAERDDGPSDAAPGAVVGVASPHGPGQRAGILTRLANRYPDRIARFTSERFTP